MQIKQWLVGIVRLRLVSADPQSLLNFLSCKGVMIRDIHWIDDLTVEITIPQSMLKCVKDVEKKFQCEVSVKHSTGFCALILRVLKRSVLAAGLIVFLFLSIYIQNHILFIEVNGNSIVSSRTIIEITKNNGLDFGTPRKNVRSEEIKNILLESIPKLQWVGINTAGCVAKIEVRERIESEGGSVSDLAPASIVAGMEGTITAITSSKGTVVCQIGQKVVPGDVLISGTNSCGDILLLTRAEGEVFAQTNRILELKTICPSKIRTVNLRTEHRSGIIFEKNLIKFFKDSGILDTTCVKISKRYDLRLPKGYVLPISFYSETVSHYDTALYEPGVLDQLWLMQQGLSYINGQMIAGSVISQDAEEILDGVRISFCCTEMIGQIKKEELFCINGKNS